MHTPATVVLLSLLFISLPVSAKKIQDVEIPDTLPVEGSNTMLVLNGAGIRENW